MSGSHYKELLRHQVNTTDDSAPERKRRKRIQKEPSTSPIIISDSNEPEVIEIDANELGSNNDKLHADDVSDSDSDSDDFEDVAIHSFDLNPMSMDAKNDDSITVAIGDKGINEGDVSGKGKRKANIISKEERKYRILFHQAYILCMIAHGSIRNKWCNNYELQQGLRAKFMTPDIVNLLQQRTTENKDLLDIVKSRRFLDGLKKVMLLYSTKFRVISKGIIRKNWNELHLRRLKAEGEITEQNFRRMIMRLRGSRDLGAQGFVALLRSIGVKARLIFSLQPPDFTSTVEYPLIEKQVAQPKEKKPIPNKILSTFGGTSGAMNSKRKFLGSLRDAVTTSKSDPVSSNSSSSDVFLEDSQYPVFWIEAWNKFAKKWVSIDPMSLNIIENAPMRRKSSFEPPSTDMRNQLTYVFAYNKAGGAKDVTRRYSQYYNAKTCKKRIPFRVDSTWYEKVISAMNPPNERRKIGRIDALEMKEFHDRDLAEGMPNNVADFKNHPLFALESQLRQNEVIYPMDKSSQCGMFRNKTKSKVKEVVIPVYKRTNVHTLRSAKAWYMRGRTLKLGANPLKVKPKVKQQAAPLNLYGLDDSDDDPDDDEDDTVRLYAEFQTQLYIPPPIVDGKIPKNAYGNIDIYTPTMVPENGYLIRTNGVYTMKMAERAAKYILEIDYARAVVGFDFGGNNGKKKSFRKIPTTKEGGIIIDIQYRDGMLLVLNNLVEEAEEEKRELIERNALQNWKFFLTKLRISHRLNAEHGHIENPKKKKTKAKTGTDRQEYDSEADSSDFSVQSEDSGSSHSSEDEEIGRGGFVVDDYQEHFEGQQEVNGNRTYDSRNEPEYPKAEISHPTKEKKLLLPVDDYNKYATEEEIMDMDSGGGFLIESNIQDSGSVKAEGGFMVETDGEGGIENGGEDPSSKEDGASDLDNAIGGGFILDSDVESENGGGGFLLEENKWNNPEEEMDVELLRDTGSGNENESNLENEAEANLSEMESKRNSSNTAGGFLVTRPELDPREHEHGERINQQVQEDDSDDDFLDAIPDTYFKENEKGELVYDPTSNPEGENTDGSSSLEDPKEKLEERPQFEEGVGANFNIYENPIDDMAATDDNDSAIDSTDEAREQPVHVETDATGHVAEVEDEFGFEYESD